MNRIRLFNVGGLAVIAVALFVFVPGLSDTESRLQCDGTLTEDRTPEPATVFLKIHRYRWWVWSSSDGTLWIEVPGRWFEHYDHLDAVRDQLQFSQEGRLRGYYSSLSGTLWLVTKIGDFNGRCTKLDA